MQEAYEKEKDAEIKKLQESISSEEKLYQMARERIANGWSTLYNDLIDYNTRAGSDINAKVTQAWQDAQKAMEKYNATYLEVYDRIGSNSSGAISGSSSSSNIVGPSNKYADSDDGGSQLIVKQMKANSEAWKQTNSIAEKNALHEANEKLKDQLKEKYKLEVNYNDKTGVWEVDKDKENIYNRYLDVYHSGGVVGDAGSLRQDEMLAVLQKGELVLDKDKQKSLDNLMKIASAITSGISTKFISPAVHAFSDFRAGYNQDAVTTNNSQSVNITFGDTIIQSEKGDTLKQHEAINRRMVNEIIDVLKIKK